MFEETAGAFGQLRYLEIPFTSIYEVDQGPQLPCRFTVRLP